MIPVIIIYVFVFVGVVLRASYKKPASKFFPSSEELTLYISRLRHPLL